MRFHCLLFLLLLPFALGAQESVSVRGRIVNARGEAVEYVQIGIPRLGIGTISSFDGSFELSVPSDTLEFHHVSYRTACFPVVGPVDELLITLEDAELAPAVLIGGETREKYLLRPGTNLFGKRGSAGFSLWNGSMKGVEVGSVARAAKPFLVQEIQFDIKANHIPGCVVSVGIYRIEGKEDVFTPVLHKPIYVKIPESGEPQRFRVSPDETLLLEPGRYFFSFQLVDYDTQALEAFLAIPEAERELNAMKLFTPLFLKRSYLRYAAVGQFDRISFNIGMGVKGLEFR